MLPEPVRVRVEMTVGSLAGVLGLVTIGYRDWIEFVFGVDPDGGNGAAEWLVVTSCLALSVALLLLALRDAGAMRPKPEATQRAG
jgi:hypothetical protein